MLLLLFLIVNFIFLEQYPFVHSDESWLAGLTRNMMEKKAFWVTEPFFDLKPRYPHAIKSFFHLLQMPFIALFGYKASSLRLLSLLGGVVCLLLFWRAARRMAPGEGIPLALTALLACDALFINASHMARQEILICGVMLGCMVLFLREDGEMPTSTIVWLGGITGLSVGLHPNSFLVACLCGSVLLSRMVLFKTVGPRQLALYIGLTGGLALVFVGASFAMDPQFPLHYLAYGQTEFELLVPVTSKLGELGYYFQKLWHRVSGTYYLPDLRLQLVLFPLLLGLAAVYAGVMAKEDRIKSQRLISVLSAVAGVLAGTVFIGRYNQNYFVFFVPLCWLLLPHGCEMVGKWPGRAGFVAVFAGVIVTATGCIQPWLGVSYEGYLEKISAFVPSNTRVIGNLNSEFYFENDCLRDYRNLSFLEENGLTFREYVEVNQVEYLIISQELEKIYNVRPKWNGVYGNLSGWYSQMKEFARLDCEELGSFSDPFYGVRIMEWLGDPQAGTITVYRVKGSNPK